MFFGLVWCFRVNVGYERSVNDCKVTGFAQCPVRVVILLSLLKKRMRPPLYYHIKTMSLLYFSILISNLDDVEIEPHTFNTFRSTSTIETKQNFPFIKSSTCSSIIVYVRVRLIFLLLHYRIINKLINDTCHTSLDLL